MTTRFLGVLIAMVLLGVLLVGCGAPSANTRDAQYTNQQMDIYQQNQPPHLYDYSMPRDVLLQIYDATMHANNTWSVWTDWSGISHGCASVGYPIPGGTQLTNPASQINRGDTGVATIPQAEPNGLYSPDTSQGTWILCLENGKAAPVYVEPPVTTYPWPVVVENGKIVDKGGDPSIEVTVRDSQGSSGAPTATPQP